MSGGEARIVLWGIEGAGKSTALHTIHARLRPESRGDLVRLPSRLDPTVFAESLTISLGEVGGRPMQLELVAVPGAEDQAMTRKQMLDRIDGVVLVLDCSPARIDANGAAIDELKSSLAAYGQQLERLPMVLVYNKRDVADPFAIEALHRRIGLRDVAVFESIATTGHGVLPALTTISKHVIRLRRDGSSARAGEHAAPVRPHEALEAGILAEGAAGAGRDATDLALDALQTTQPDWGAVTLEAEKPDADEAGALRIVSAGQASVDAEGELRVPLVLGDADGRTRSFVLQLRLDESARTGG